MYAIRSYYALGAEADRFSLDLRTQCDSSNTVLAAAPARDDGRVAVLVCDAQTAGRGRRGRTWLAWPGCSLTFSARCTPFAEEGFASGFQPDLGADS